MGSFDLAVAIVSLVVLAVIGVAWLVDGRDRRRMRNR